MPVSHEPARHYDRVHQAWRIIMGAEFHYGYFTDAEDTLEGATARLTSQMRQRVGIAAGEDVLDIGCGTGQQSCDLAHDLGARVLGITTSAEGVAAATALAAERGLGGARFEQRDGTDNRLPDASFDVVWALESSHLMRDRAALLRESARVLRPGGRLVLCDIVRRREIPFLEVRERRADLAVLRAAFGEARMDPLEEYAATLRDLGLRVVDRTDISDQTYPTLAAWRANAEAGADRITELIGAQALADFVRATEILEAFWSDATLGYGILAAAMPA